MTKKLCLFSGGMDSLAIVLEYIEKYGEENVITLGFNYGQRHFLMENTAASDFCSRRGIKRIVLDVPIGQIGGCSLVDHSIPVTQDMSQQRSTVVPMRNAIFLMLAAAVAQVQGCDVITHGACKEDQEAYRDCRPEFFKFMEIAIQAGITSPVKGSEGLINDFYGVAKLPDVKYELRFELLPERIDIKIETPLILESKAETMARILKKYPVDIYKESYTCYNGKALSCGKCPACQERLAAFEANGVIDPLMYSKE